MLGQKYFITFINDYSQYMDVYLLHNKNEALDAFKVFKAACGKLLGWIRLLLGRGWLMWWGMGGE